MKKVSVKMFFTVMWRGLCQALRWFMELFGYKGEGKWTKCVWRMFATSMTIIITSFVVIFVWALGESIYEKYYKEVCCYDPNCAHAVYISRNVYYHDVDDGHGYIFNCHTGEKTVKHVQWIATPDGKDSLVCFSNGKKRGYFSKNTGKVVVEAKYDHAWIFSDGLASVEENGFIKFIDGTGKVVIDKKMSYNPHLEGYIFHGGYCVVNAENGNLCGLMDVHGEMALPIEYTRIYPSCTWDYWCVQKGEQMGVLDKQMKFVLPMMECSLQVNENTINVTMLDDHTIRKYNLQGELINNFYITYVNMLEYEKEDIVYHGEEDEDGTYTESEDDWYHPKATARLRSYVAGDGYEGLMTADGHVVTLPLYHEIEAIGADLYLCTSDDYDKVIVNGNGELVR